MTAKGRKTDPKRGGGISGEQDTSEFERFAVLLEQRDQLQAEAQQRLIQVQTNSAQNLAEVANSLSKVYGTQQDAHDVLGAVEKAIMDHDNTLIRHIDAVKQRNRELDKDQDRTLTVLEDIKKAIIASTTSTQNLVDKQVGLGKSLVAIAAVSTAVATLLGVILLILKFLSDAAS